MRPIRGEARPDDGAQPSSWAICMMLQPAAPSPATTILARDGALVLRDTADGLDQQAIGDGQDRGSKIERQGAAVEISR